MIFRIKYFNKIPLITEDSFEFITKDISKYPTFCGAGKGAGDWLVPEGMWRLKVSPACHIHDDMWDKASGIFFDFIISNIIFLFNICMIIIVMSTKRYMGVLRCGRAFTYFFAVSTFGWKIFKKLKGMK